MSNRKSGRFQSVEIVLTQRLLPQPEIPMSRIPAGIGMPASSASLEKSACRFCKPGLEHVVPAHVVEREARRDELQDPLLLRHLLFLGEHLQKRLLVEDLALREDLRDEVADLVGGEAPHREGQTPHGGLVQPVPTEYAGGQLASMMREISPSSGSSYSTT